MRRTPLLTPALLAVTTMLAGGLVACSSTKAGSSNAGKPASAPASLPGCDKVACSGEIAGAPYAIRLPASWNGTLLLWSHGYRQARPSPPDFTPVDRKPEAVPNGNEELATRLLAQGYALAGSAYASNGWAVPDGVKADQDLYRFFRDKVAKPQRVYAWGDSLGGLITETLSETHPDWLSAAAPRCGVLAGSNRTLDLALDAAYAIRTLLIPDLKLSNYSSYEEAVGNFDKVLATLKKAPSDIKGTAAKLLLVAAIADPSRKTQSEDGHDLISRLTAELTVIGTAVGYGTFGRWEIEQRVHGNPSTNDTSTYAPRVDAEERALINQLAPGQVDGWIAQLEAGKRVSADPAARQAADGLGNPQGDPTVPTLTLHTEYDDLVPVQEEAVFAAAVAKNNATEKVLQLYTAPPATYPARNGQTGGAPYGAGHCNFSMDESLATVRLLDGWARSGTKPDTATTRAAFTGSTGLDLGYSPKPWPVTTR